MRKIVCVTLVAVLFDFLSFGNIAAPVQAPAVMGDVFIIKEQANPLRIEKETLLIDITDEYYHRSKSRATYVIVNPTSEEVTLPALFMTPGGSNISVRVDGVPVESVSVSIPESVIPWARIESGSKVRGFEYGASSFEISIGPEGRKTVDVEFILSAGYDNTLGEHGMTAVEASHLLNMFKGDNSTGWYRYDLFSASTFDGGFGSISIEVRVPLASELQCNLALARASENKEGGYYVMSGEFDGIPSAYVDIKAICKTTYNVIGGTVAAGCSFPFDGRGVHFTSKALFDVYFYNFQVSAGIEADPFTSLYHGLLLFTILPPGRSGSYGWLVDVRGGCGFAFDFMKGLSPGFAVFAGFRLLPVVYAVSYKLFPFEGGVIAHELGLTIEFGI